MSVAVLWQHVFQAVVCVMSAVQRAVARCTEGCPGWAATFRSECRDILIVSFNILYV